MPDVGRLWRGGGGLENYNNAEQNRKREAAELAIAIKNTQVKCMQLSVLQLFLPSGRHSDIIVSGYLVIVGAVE